MKPDFTFAKDDAHRFLPWHIGIMVSLATFLLLLVFSLGQWVGGHQEDYAASISVILPGSLDKVDEKTTQVKTLLASQPEIAGVKQVGEVALREMLAPWIGNGDALTDTPLPVILDIALKNGKELDGKSLQKLISEIDPAIELDLHNSWEEAFAAFIRVLQWLAVLLVCAILGAMTVMITFSARASLHMHGRTVNLLHGMGAEDDYIAKQFQNEHFKIGLMAGGGGVLCAALAYVALGRSVAAINAPVLPVFDFSLPHALLIAIMPFFCASIVLLSTRYAVLVQLRKVL